MPDVLVDNEILLYGDVGVEEFWGLQGFMARDVVNALARLRDQDVVVRLNSGGGLIDEGVAIYNSLRAHGKKITIYVDSGASSAASIIAMAGDNVVMRTGSYLMIHDPAQVTIGNLADHEDTIESLDVQADGMAAIYAAKSKKDKKEVRRMMAATTWMTADEAVAAGFADQVAPEEAVGIAAFDYERYMNTPEPIIAQAKAKGWKNIAATAAARKQELLSMATPTPPTPTPPADPAATAAATQAQVTAAIEAERARVASISNLGATAKAPASLIEALIKDGTPVDKATARFTRATDVRSAVAKANKMCPAIALTEADAFIAADTPAEEVSRQLFEKMAAVSAATPINTAVGGAPGAGLDMSDAAVDAMWKRTIAATQATLGKF